MIIVQINYISTESVLFVFLLRFYMCTENHLKSIRFDKLNQLLQTIRFRYKHWVTTNYC